MFLKIILQFHIISLSYYVTMSMILVDGILVVITVITKS